MMAHTAPDREPARKRLFAPLTDSPIWRNPILHDGPVIDLDSSEWRRLPAFIADAAMMAGRK